jgi:hypothetical protein
LICVLNRYIRGVCAVVLPVRYAGSDQLMVFSFFAPTFDRLMGAMVVITIVHSVPGPLLMAPFAKSLAAGAAVGGAK